MYKVFYKAFILAITVTFYCSAVFGQAKSNIQFSHLTTKNGLSQSTINCIVKDITGFLWFGTQDGLNKYDGYKFKVYRNRVNDSTSIPFNTIKSLYVDHAGTLWVGTLGRGLAKYNPNSDSFTTYGKSAINCIFEDTNQNLWLGTFSGLYFFDKKKQAVMPARFASSKHKQFITDPVYSILEDKNRKLWVGTSSNLYQADSRLGHVQDFTYPVTGSKENNITALIEDKNGVLWIGTRHGIYQHNVKKTRVPSVKHPKIPPQLTNAAITCFYKNNDNCFWVGTEDGLCLFDPAKGSLFRLRKNAHNDQSMSNSSVQSLYLDNQEILWVGTFAGGINKYDKNQPGFTHYRIYDTQDLNINADLITSFAEAGGNIWIGTDGGGLYLWDRQQNRYHSFNPSSASHKFPSFSILCVKLGSNGSSLWIGTYDKGLIRMDLNTLALTQYNTKNSFLSNNAVFALQEDSKGNIWAGTNGGGISVINPLNNKTIHYQYSKNGRSLVNNNVRALTEAADGSMWIGTYGGISVYSPRTGKFTSLTHGSSNLGDNIVYSIFQDAEDVMWVGTMGSGLNRYNSSQKNFIHFTEKDGLANNIVNAILEDKKGDLWISTANGISHFSPRNNKFHNYNSVDGLQTNEFILGAGMLTRSGEILFGGTDGYEMFKPEKIRNNNSFPPVIITDFLLPGNSDPFKTKNQPVYLLAQGKQPVKLKHNQANFTIEFAALSYSVPEKNQYAYMLEGFDKGWHYIGNERKATYTNIDPGTYTFKVKASNNNGMWNSSYASLNIQIIPAIWQTTYAYTFYVLVICAILYLIYADLKAREKLKSEIYYQKLTAEKINELNNAKFNFFTNISHELRTPLSLIVDPLRRISSEDTSLQDAKTMSRLAYKNAIRLLNLVNQLLDFRKLEGELKLNVQLVNVARVTAEVVEAFTGKAQQRRIQLVLKAENEQEKAQIDVEKFGKIITNLVANAFKFTPDGGKIEVDTSAVIINDKRYIEIKVSDTGAGIPAACKSKIFDVFYQIAETPRFEIESTGIGLAFVKEMVLLHGGIIEETGKEGQGAIFVLKIPALQQHITIDIETGLLRQQPHYNEPALQKLPSAGPAEDRPANQPVVLLVEDNPELRAYLAATLDTGYRVEQAWGGIRGFEVATTLIPDIIVSDIAMPDGDGLELCERLKADERTSHIPVILLTAKQADETKIEGFGKGADAYLSKPFNSELLKTQINNLLTSRKRLRELFANAAAGNTDREYVSLIDKNFIERAEQIVVDNLGDASFDLDLMANALKMNRQQLLKKIKAISNQTPLEFVNCARLNQAAKLLLCGDFTISEVGYKVGFSDPSNFTRAFIKIYGKSPKKYINDTREIVYNNNNKAII